MWLFFCVSVFVALAIATVPGMVIAKAAGLSWHASLCVSGPISCALYSIMGIALYRTGHPGAYPLLLATVLLLIAIALTLLLFRRWRRLPPPPVLPSLSIPTTLLYFSATALVLGGLFLSALGDPSNINQIGDNAYHLTRINDIAEEGNYSAIDASFYVGVVPESQILDPSTGFYPEGFHVVAALTQTITSSNVSITENATIFVFSSIIYSLGFSAFMQLSFGPRSRAARLGAFLTCACVMFPFRLLVVNGFYPFVAGLSCAPSLMSLLLLCFGGSSSRPAPQLLLPLLLSLAGTAFIHPSACLAVGAMAIPYVIFVFVPKAAEPWSKKASHPKRCVLLAQVAAAALLAIAWVAVYNLPALDNVTGFTWNWHVNFIQAIYLVLSLGLRFELPSWPLALLVLVGLIRSLSSKKYTWVGLTYLFMALIFILGVSTSGELQHLFAGFWYTDPERTSALVALWCVPLAALGLDLLCNVAARALKADPLSATRSNYISTALIVLTFLVVNFLPNHQVYGGQVITPFGATRVQLIKVSNGDNELNYTPEEKAFVEKALNIIPQDALVINVPYDGSVFSSPLNGLNIFYRANTSAPASTESEGSREIREHLNEIAENDSVAEAASALGAEYVLLLGTEEYEATGSLFSSVYNAFFSDDWIGILGITDDTPGFETILADGDMRLYRIIGGDKESDG